MDFVNADENNIISGIQPVLKINNHIFGDDPGGHLPIDEGGKEPMVKKKKEESRKKNDDAADKKRNITENKGREKKEKIDKPSQNVFKKWLEEYHPMILKADQHFMMAFFMDNVELRLHKYIQ
jgi:hypothetical protein